MKKASGIIDLNEIEKFRYENIVDVGLTASAMVRLFKQGTKEKIRGHTVKAIKKMLGATSELEYQRVHSDFCKWGIKTIALSKKTKHASYGQVAKTIDVVLKVVVYYCHLPECEKSKEFSQWLNAAVDTKMMAKLRRCYPNAMKPWPRTIEKVDSKQKYDKIQETVRKFIHDKHQDSITPAQFDDYYWKKLNRK